jgi:hypothetical protein
MEFRSSVLKLPPDIRTELDNFIDNGKASLAIYSALKGKYGSVLQVPSVPTIIRYVKYYNLQKRNVQAKIVEERIAYKFEDGLKEIEGILIQISEGKEPRFNKIKLLEGLVAKCLKRISELELYPGQKTDKEVAIARYISEAKNIVESLTKLSKEVQSDERVLIQLIRNESRGVLEAVREVILDIAPDKYDLFKEKLGSKMREHGAVVDVEPTVLNATKNLLETTTGDVQEIKEAAEILSEQISEVKENHDESKESNKSDSN